MGMFPLGCRIIRNPYNKIPGFTCTGGGGGTVHFVPGFPVMAWPMMAAVLDAEYAPWFQTEPKIEKSVILMGAMEATLTPLMVDIESAHPVKVFSLPSVDHPEYGRHIELGVKGEATVVDAAFGELLKGLASFECKLGPELVRKSS